MKDVVLEYENGSFIPATLICCFKVNTNDKRYTFYSLGEKEGELEKVYVGEQLKIKNELFIDMIHKEDQEDFQKLLQSMNAKKLREDARYETRLYNLEGKVVKVRGLCAIKLRPEIIQEYFFPIGEEIVEEKEKHVFKKKKPIFFVILFFNALLLFFLIFYGTPIIIEFMTSDSKMSVFKDNAMNVIDAMEYHVMSEVVVNPNYYEDVDLSKNSLNIVFPNPVKGHVISLGEGKIALEMTDGTYCAKKAFTEVQPTVTKLKNESCDGEELSKSLRPKDDQPIYGDVNQDQTVNESDLEYLQIILKNKTVDLLTEKAKKNADVNLDDIVDDQDAVVLSNYLSRVEGYETLPYIEEPAETVATPSEIIATPSEIED